VAHCPLSGSENETYLLALYLRQSGFGLGEPAGHVHGAVQVDSGGQGGTGRLSTDGLSAGPLGPEEAVADPTRGRSRCTSRVRAAARQREKMGLKFPSVP
jgi:hypothetical protein